MVDQTIREYRVWSIEYRGEAELKGGNIGKPDDWLGIYIFGSRVSGDRVSGTGCQVRVRVRVRVRA